MDFNGNGYAVHEIVRADDPAWEAWKEMYFASFPPSERMSEGCFLRVMEDKARGEAADKHILTMSAGAQDVPPLGMAYYEASQSPRVGFLWYVATRPGLRGQGYGVAFYAEICRRLVAEGARMLVFEVEIPDLPGQDAGQEVSPDRQWAQRRIGWYQRQGALVLEGIRYFQEVDTGVPPTEMWLMVHLFEPMGVEEVFATAQELFGDSLTRTGILKLA